MGMYTHALLDVGLRLRRISWMTLIMGFGRRISSDLIRLCNSTELCDARYCQHWSPKMVGVLDIYHICKSFYLAKFTIWFTKNVGFKYSTVIPLPLEVLKHNVPLAD